MSGDDKTRWDRQHRVSSGDDQPSGFLRQVLESDAWHIGWQVIVAQSLLQSGLVGGRCLGVRLLGLSVPVDQLLLGGWMFTYFRARPDITPADLERTWSEFDEKVALARRSTDPR